MRPTAPIRNNEKSIHLRQAVAEELRRKDEEAKLQAALTPIVRSLG
jgi:hypothetical protein